MKNSLKYVVVVLLALTAIIVYLYFYEPSFKNQAEALLRDLWNYIETLTD